MPDPDAALREDVAKLRDCRQLGDGVRVEGWRYDVETGRIVRLERS
jgi:carbonic anhydrase